MLSLIRAYRGFAALLVVLYHASAFAQRDFGERAWLHPLAFGGAGVQFFFVLSGFIMYYIHREHLGVPEYVSTYVRKRVVRIYPLYILVTLVWAPFLMLVPNFGEPYHKEVSALLLSLLLVPQAHQPLLAVAWTLVHEVIFYALFAALILNKTAGRLALGAWFCSAAVASVLQVELTFPLWYLLSTNNLLFGIGLLTAVCRQRFGWSLFALGNAAFLATGWVSLHYAGPLVILSYGLASAAIILTAERLEKPFRNAALGLLGDASYAIYLTHYPVVSLTCKVLQAAGVDSADLAFIAATILAVACGIGVHLVVEKPLLRACHDWTMRRTALRQT